MNGLPLPAAAQELGISIPTLRRWLRAGCPQASRGRRGRGHAALIDPEQVRDWQAGKRAGGDAGRVLDQLQADAAGLAVESCLATIAALSPVTNTGAEHRLLRLAVGDAGRRFADALAQWAQEKC